MVNVFVPLDLLLTKPAVEQEVVACLLKCLENGERVYRSYRQERVVEKSNKMSADTSKCKLPRFTDQPQKTSAVILKERTSHPRTWQMHRGAWSLQMRREWSSGRFSFTICWQHLHCSTVTLLTARSHYLLRRFSLNWTSSNGVTSLLLPHVVVDFMSKLRQMLLSQFPSLGVVITPSPVFVHLVLDSYTYRGVFQGMGAYATYWSKTSINIWAERHPSLSNLTSFGRLRRIKRISSSRYCATHVHCVMRRCFQLQPLVVKKFSTCWTGFKRQTGIWWCMWSGLFIWNSARALS